MADMKVFGDPLIWVICPRCHGFGYRFGCIDCNGSGRVVGKNVEGQSSTRYSAELKLQDSDPDKPLAIQLSEEDIERLQEEWRKKHG